MTLETAARDYIWLCDSRRGVSPEEIAERFGVGVRAVRNGLKRARELEARLAQSVPAPDPAGPGFRDPDDLGFRLIPSFPVGAFTPQSECSHGPIPPGSKLCCMVCHASGMDDHPGLKRETP